MGWLIFCPPLEAQSDLSEYLDNYGGEKTISMDFSNAMINDVLKIFSQQSGLNFICSASVSDKIINLYLEKVPVEEALERILSANDLTYEIKPGSNIFVVKELPAQSSNLMTRIYPLRYASVSSAKIMSTLSSSGGDDEGSSGGSDEDGGAGGMIATIEAILSDQGSVVEDPRTNSLIITDAASKFPLIEQTISMLDVRVPLISIEVEMLDVSKQTVELIGAKFGDTPVEFSGATKRDIFPFNLDNFADDNGGSVTFYDSEGEEISPYYSSSLSFSGLSFILQFLRTQTDTRNLARPRILTLNNETAEIRISTDEAIGIAATTTSSEGTASSVSEAERVQTGVFLKVTPQANIHTGEITMAVEPSVVEAKTGGTFEGTTFKDPESRGVKSIMRVESGNTIIIGGLLRSDSRNIKTKVPWLSRIPIINLAFKHNDSTGLERELLVFITPSIVTDGDEKYYPKQMPSLNESTTKTTPTHSRPQPSTSDLNQIEKQIPQLPAQNKATKKQARTFNDLLEMYGPSSQRDVNINNALQELENKGF